MEKIILRNLLSNDLYVRKALPFLKDEYFSGAEQKLFQTIKSFILKYNIPPTTDALLIEIESNKNISEPEYNSVLTVLEDFKTNKTETPIDWLIDSTEQFCQDRAIYNALGQALEIIKDNPKVSASKGTIPKLLSDALAITFDPNVGHDYLEQYQDRYDYYHRIEDRIPFDLEFFNKITKGGLPRKTLNIILAGCVHPETKVCIRFRKKDNDS